MRPKNWVLVASVLASCGLGHEMASAHHGTAVSYDGKTWITVTGTVTEFRWRNPHSALFLDTVSDSGEQVVYAIELASPILMLRTLGWTRDTFKPGDRVEFRVHPSRTGAPVGECISDCLVYVNGARLAGTETKAGD